MFNVGDKVVYPMHGAGVIEAIEEKEILGETKKYYVMRIPVGDMKVMIPLGGDVGLREVTERHVFNGMMEQLKNDKITLSTNWNRRYRANLDKIRSGEMMDLAEVVKELMVRDREKGLSTGERKMLDNARQIFISEMVLSINIDEDQAFAMLDNIMINENASI